MEQKSTKKKIKEANLSPKKTGIEKRLANLAPAWKKGECGNPAGRPEGSISLTSMIKRKLMELSPDQRRTALEVLAENIIQDALDGKDTPVKLIWNYLDGLPKGESEPPKGNTLNQVNIIAGDEILGIAKEVAKKLMLKEIDGNNNGTT